MQAGVPQSTQQVMDEWEEFLQQLQLTVDGDGDVSGHTG